MGGGDVDLVEMRIFHTSTSLSFKMNQIASVSYICFIFSSNETNQNICFIVSPNEPKKTRESKTTTKTLNTIWLPPWPHVVCGVFFFLGFSRGFWHFGSKTKKNRENIKNQTNQNSRHYMATPLAPCSL